MAYGYDFRRKGGFCEVSARRIADSAILSPNGAPLGTSICDSERTRGTKGFVLQNSAQPVSVWHTTARSLCKH